MISREGAQYLRIRSDANSILEVVAVISSFHPNLLHRQKANKILRVRYGVDILPRPQRDPVWLSAMT